MRSLDRIIAKALDSHAEKRFQNAAELLDALDSWKPGLDKITQKAKPAHSEMSKTALGIELSSPNRDEAEKMAQKAIELKRAGKLGDAADIMEEAFNKWPDLRGKYANYVKLWRCGISM